MANKKKRNQTGETIPAPAMPERPSGFESPWTTGMDDTLQQILNRKEFKYDMNQDAFYNQYKDRFQRQGKMASQNAMGQAAALTGGYGNSYAQGVGTQQYQNWMQGLNDKIPELYKLAADKYNMEGQRLLNQYNLYGQREAQDFQRWDAQRKDNYNKLIALINVGYDPTDKEIEGAGMTRPQVEALLRIFYLQHPELDPNTPSPGGGGGDVAPWPNPNPDKDKDKKKTAGDLAVEGILKHMR